MTYQNPILNSIRLLIFSLIFNSLRYPPVDKSPLKSSEEGQHDIRVTGGRARERINGGSIVAVVLAADPLPTRGEREMKMPATSRPWW